MLPILSPYHTEIIEITSYINSGYNPYKTILFVGRQANITNSNTQRKDIVASSNNNLKIYTDGETIYIVPYGSSGGANVYLSTSAIFTPVVVTKDVSALTELTTVIS